MTVARHGRTWKPEQRDHRDAELIHKIYDVVLEKRRDPALDLLIIGLGIETATRSGAALALTTDSLDIANRWITYFKDKNDKPRSTPISERLLEDLLTLYVERAGDPATNGMAPSVALKRTLSGEISLSPGRPLIYRKNFGSTGGFVPATSRTVDSLFEVIRKELPEADRLGVRFHDLRKTGASFIERAGGQAVAQRFLGHEAEQTVTGLYVQASDAELEKVFRAVFG